MTPLVGTLFVHGLLGAFDTLVFHELVGRLRHDPVRNRRELVLHGGRSCLYAVVFSLAATGRASSSAVLGLLLVEAPLTAIDVWVEARDRAVRPPVGERVAHLFMFCTWLGILAAWWRTPEEPTTTWVRSGLLSALAIGSGVSGAADLVAAGRGLARVAGGDH